MTPAEFDSMSPFEKALLQEFVKLRRELIEVIKSLTEN